MKLKGKLIRWNEDRGFGFIKLPNNKDDIFIHISELKTMSRRPQLNDVIYFDIVTDVKGKTKAINATIEGVPEKPIKPHRNKTNTNKKLSKTPSVGLIIGIITIIYISYPLWSKNLTKLLPVNFLNEDFSGCQCEGKQYCSQMTSCKEARFYLKNCPNVKIDGDNDGIPCESQWCQ